MNSSSNCLLSFCLFGVFLFSQDSFALGAEFSLLATEKTYPSSVFSEIAISKRKAFSYLKEHKYQNAVEEFTNALQYKEGRDAFELFLYRGSAYLHLKQIDKARRDITKAIQLDPENPLGYIQRSTLYGVLGENVQALEDLDHVILLNPSYADAYWRRGSAFSRLGKSTKALEDYSSAIRLGETNPKIYQERAFALESLGRYKDALFNYSHALNLEPRDYHGLLRRGWVYQCLGDLQNALEDFNTILSDRPDDFEALLQRAYVYIKLQKIQSAHLDFMFLVSNGSHDKDVFLGLAYVHYRLGNKQKALEINEALLKALDSNVKIAASFQMGLFLLSQGKVEDARKWYTQGVMLAQESLSLSTIDAAIEEFHTAYGMRGEFAKESYELIFNILTKARTEIAPDVSQDNRRCQKPNA